jgi:polyisoprenyl-teichoic acid--peptidoglycan teichoic acid transferase
MLKSSEIFMNKIGFDNHHIDGPGVSSSNLEPRPPRRPKARRFLKFTLILMAVAILGLGGFVLVRASGLAGKIFVGQETNLYQRLTDLISSQTGGSKLIGERDGQINVLLLGIGGPGHDGPYLSDTIILAQIRPEEKKATLTSIPRDYLVNTKELGQRKINAVFAESYAKHEDWDRAGESIREVVEKISGLEVPYFAVIDFKGFEKTVDLLGGVDIQVERTFTDYTYPDSKFGYIPPVTFKEGPETMDGKRALIFARSRHAAGPEGTDFARSVRQQKILSAAKSKLVALNIIADSGKINELFTIVGDHFHTNLSPGQMLRAYGLTKDFSAENVVSLSLDPSGGLICPQILEESGAYVLTICAGKTSSDIQDYFKNSFATGQLGAEKAVVWLADSSPSGSLYKKAETELTNAGLTVYKVIYGGKPLPQSVVYSVNHKPSTAEYITSKLDASPVSLPPPGIKIDPKKVDVIVILGTD